MPFPRRRSTPTLSRLLRAPRVVLLAAALPLLLPGALAAQAERSAPLPVASLDSAWASIERAYFDTALVHGAWRITYDSLRRAVADADDDGVRVAIRRLLAVPGKSHFALIPGSAVPTADGARPAGRPGTTGIDVRAIGDTLVVWRVEAGSPAARAGVRAGSIVTRIDTVVTDSLRARLHVAFPEDPRQTRFLLTAYAKRRLGGFVGDSVRLTLRAPRARRGRSLTLALAPIEGRSTQFGNLPPMVVVASLDSVRVRAASGATMIPVIGFSAWFPVIINDLNSYLFAIRGAPGVILDLRGNPGGVVGMIPGVAGHFTDSSVSLGTMYGRGATLNLRTNPRTVGPANERVGVFTGPIAILVDDFTASTSEFFAAGLQGLGRARIFGVTSAGQALPSLMARLPNGDVLMHPIADHVDAAGRTVEGIGVVPDELTPLTRRDLAAGRDAALDAAMAWLARTIP